MEAKDAEFAQKVESDGVTNKSLRARRRENAEKMAKLGFKNAQGVDEIHDPIRDALEIDDARFQKALKESRERKPVKMVTEVQGVSKDETIKSMLQDHEVFK